MYVHATIPRPGGTRWNKWKTFTSNNNRRKRSENEQKIRWNI